MIIAIGNAPSSGSTLLADLLDSLPFAVCGPELSLFASQAYYDDFGRVKREGFFSSRSPVIYEMRLRFQVSKLNKYGFEEYSIDKYIRECNSLQDFSEKFFDIYSTFRGKKCTIFFEKTPENIHCAKKFLDSFEDGAFLHIVRNPLYVYKSLRKRGFLAYIARNTWLIDEASVYELRNHHRFFTIRYEELIKNPYATVTRFLGKIGITFDSDELARLYKENAYRRTTEIRINSWSFKEYGIIGDANEQKVAFDDLKALNAMLKTKVGHKYAKEFDLPEVEFQELTKLNGYEFDNPRQSPASKSEEVLACDFRSFNFLLKKSLLDVIYRDCDIRSIPNYLRPAERILE